MIWLIQLVIVLVIATLTWLIYPSFIGAVYVPTPMKNVHRMLEIAKVGPNDILYDMGSGDGRIIITAAIDYGARAIGIEADPIRVAYTRWKIARKNLQDRVKVIRKNFYNVKLTDATIITVYQGTEINKKLAKKFEGELAPGSRVVSYFFRFEEWTPISVDEKNEVYLYKV
jgi:precorrin-6B methylase 2